MVLAGVVLGAAVLLVTSTTWVRATTSSAIDPDVQVSVTGSVMAPGSSAGGLVVLAAATALALGGRWGRWLAAGGVVLGGVLVIAASLGAPGDAAGAARAAAQTAVGVAQLDDGAALTVMPWFALVLGAAAVALGLRAAVTARGWGEASTRHEDAARAPVAGAAVGAVGRPTDHPDGVPTSAAEGRARSSGVDEHAAWDALSRGDDPT